MSATLSLVARRLKGGKAVTHERTSPPVVAARVTEIAAIMRRGDWRRGASAAVLAEEWGLATNTVEQLASEAWRRVCSEANDADAARPTIAGTLASSLAAAADAGQYKAVASLADVWSRVVGARAAERHEHAVVVADFERLPREDQAKWLRERAKRLLEAAERIESDVRGDATS